MAAKILICDDDEGILDLVELILKEEGFETIPEINSLNIANIVNREHPDLLLLDLWMPVLSGDQVLRSLRENPATRGLPVIVISASRDGKTIAMNAGATDFIAKPFDLDQLVEKVRTVLPQD
ncbi:response regulator receiver domain-containing protein [Mucilaginibacter yixingensis]|uniref:Response regulator receiver domain-containing protein n=1 Tax=Mucilaginibacter yixingensis TaxID=1295612 RepID=A0A2T5JEB6_9SPHI|nr:response regulator [Mucilaginibacter yixingensis]PTR00105.1 response regulator receiver domain-containing protein [Mucilaginibacter yixingensis]